MRGARRTVSWLAIAAIALHGILLGLAPLAAAANTDPFTVICHSDPQAVAPVDSAPAEPGLLPATGCEHCNLCSVTAPPAALDDVLTGRLAPARLLQVLRPASGCAHSRLATTPNRARGPPQPV